MVAIEGPVIIKPFVFCHLLVDGIFHDLDIDILSITMITTTYPAGSLSRTSSASTWWGSGTCPTGRPEMSIFKIKHLKKYWRKRMQPAHWHVTPNASSHHHHRARSWHHVPIPLNNDHLTRRAKTYRTWRSLSAPPLGQEPHCRHKFCYLKISCEDFAFILSNICSRSYQCIVCRTEGSNSSLDLLSSPSMFKYG